MAHGIDKTAVTTRQALPQDAKTACAVLRDSITTLCVADHDNDKSILAAWLHSKTPENLRQWITSDDGVFIVTEMSGEICGVACLKASGDIVLCYVASVAVRQGVGRNMLMALEEQARQWRLTELFLTSTRTALSFYERCGYSRVGPTASCFGVDAYPMHKALLRQDAIPHTSN